MRRNWRRQDLEKQEYSVRIKNEIVNKYCVTKILMR